MTFTPTQILNLAFIAQYGDDFRYELADGKLIDMEPIGPHEAIGGKLAIQIGIAITQAQHPWLIPRTCLIRPFSDVATARRPDIVILDETVLSSEPRWEQEPIITGDRSNWSWKSSAPTGRLITLAKWKNTSCSTFPNTELRTEL